jgi:hypothetical protein
VTLRRLLAPLLAFPGAVWASHPLMTEDTGVLGAARWQVELHGERSRDREAGARTRGADASGVLSYGMYAATDKLKLALDVGGDTNPDPESGSAMRELVLGLGVKKGLSDPADDRAVLAGLKFRW